MNFARVSFVGSVVVVLGACATGHYATVDPGHAAFVIPHHIAEGTGEGEDLPADAGPPPRHAALQAPPLSGSAPDPEPLRLAEQWQFSMLYQGGNASVERVEKRTLTKPITTARRMGRFALELWIGHELIDRARFDFPLIAAEEAPGVTRRPLHDPPSFGPHAIARLTVLVPNSPRATRLVLVDRATEKSQELPWPPDREPSAPQAQGAPAESPAPPPPRVPPASPSKP
ncbi:MAG: hypothetical protein ABI548_07785 [Polyangiaceae bacterium]